MTVISGQPLRLDQDLRSLCPFGKTDFRKSGIDPKMKGPWGDKKNLKMKGQEGVKRMEEEDAKKLGLLVSKNLLSPGMRIDV